MLKERATVRWSFLFSFILAPMRRLLFLITCISFFACGRSGDDNKNKAVFRYNEPGGITSLDPAYCRNSENIWAINMLYNGLVQFDSNLNVIPAIAHDWEISEDGLEYIFYLRGDVFFHNDPCFKTGKGRKVKAFDVAYSFDRLVAPETASPGTWVFEYVQRDSITQKPYFKAINDTTVVIRLREPFPAFMSVLAMQYCSIVPVEAVLAYGNDLARHPVGTGPFKFFIWEDGVKLVLHKNEHYFERDVQGKQLPYLDAVAISFLKDRNTNFLSVLKGDFDFLSGLDASYKDELLSVSGELNPKYKKHFFLQRQTYLKTDYLGILVDSTQEVTRNNPLLKKGVRKALNKAIDREEMIRFLRNNIGVSAAQGFVPSPLMRNRPLDMGYQYDVFEARNQLAGAGYPNGKGMPVITITTTSTGAEICEYIQSQWQKLGIKVKVEVVPEANHRDGVANSKYLLFRKTWVADYPDAQNFLSVFNSSGFAPNGPNYTHFKNGTFDSLYAETLKMTDDNERQQQYLLMDQLVLDEAPVIPLFYDEIIRLVSNRVSGLSVNALNLLELKRVKIQTGSNRTTARLP